MQSIFRPGLFDGHVALVTGGGSGIGLAIASVLAELGARIAICGRDEERLARGRATLATISSAPGGASSGGSASAASTSSASPGGVASAASTVKAGKCDIREAEQVAAFVREVRAELGEI